MRKTQVLNKYTRNHILGTDIPKKINNTHVGLTNVCRTFFNDCKCFLRYLRKAKYFYTSKLILALYNKMYKSKFCKKEKFKSLKKKL